ncbi:hypothetical protein AJ79_08066 [Helicocarpus griseus UAMH5409]|uniref:Secreted protein n=1 Tax=Helicocarpus griseus UAMH5409 TaxID=1447875 RepID=A0A2B7WWP5_9EURO|nr:hypothetical protein AJ79_08066 [Helicocarpus griseus UAMH5409]
MKLSFLVHVVALVCAATVQAAPNPDPAPILSPFDPLRNLNAFRKCDQLGCKSYGNSKSDHLTCMDGKKSIKIKTPSSKGPKLGIGHNIFRAMTMKPCKKKGKWKLCPCKAKKNKDKRRSARK